MKPDEVCLWEAYEADPSDENRNAIALRYIDFVRLHAHRYSDKLSNEALLTFDDFVSIGFAGLCESIASFDRSKGNLFSTYATRRVVGAFGDAMRGLDHAPRLERIKQKQNPEHVVSSVVSIDVGRKWQGSEFEPGRYETLDLLCQKATLPEKSQTEKDDFWRNACKGFSKQERLIVILYFVESVTMKAIGVQLGFSESRVSQIMTNLLKRLKDRIDIQSLREEYFV